MRAYVHLLRTPGVPRLLAAAVLGRTSGTMIGATLALAVLHAGGSLSTAGWSLTSHAICVAALAPLGGRLVDRIGARPVMAAYILANTAAFGVLYAVLARSEGAGLIPLAAALVGATNPPTSAVLRGQWPRIVAEDRLHTAYALDSVSNSAMFVVGPPVAGILAAVAAPDVAVLVAMGTKLVGDTLLALTPGLHVRESAGTGRTPRALRERRVRLLLAIAALDTFTYGCLEVLTVSHGRAAAATTGILLGLVSLGEIGGGLWYGSRQWQRGMLAQLALLHLATSAAILTLGFSSLRAVTVVALLGAGLVGGARDTLNQLLLARASDERSRTETFAWLTTVMWGGFAAGTAAAGVAHDAAGNPGIGVTSAVASGLAVVVTWRLWALSGARAPWRSRPGTTSAASRSAAGRDLRR